MDRIGRYKIVGELGRGAMGVVYHAIDPNIGRPVAVKTIRISDAKKPEERARLQERLFREARSAGMLSHPGIVTIYDVEQQDDLAYIAMEFVDGPTLEHLLSQDPPISGRQALEVLGQTAAALDYAHQKGIVHRDIKPANVMIAADGTAKITDFGIAKISDSENLTVTGTIVGTPHYMSPEQVQGQKVDGRSDQFSLAVIAFEILTGEKPYTGEHLSTVVYKIVAEEPAPPHRLNPTLTAPIENVLRKALSKKPDARYGTCQEFVGALDKACAAGKGWQTMARGGTLTMATVADVPAPALPMPPARHARRAGESTANSERAAKPKPGFLSFLAAILVAAGLLALIGWQAAPWLTRNAAPVAEKPAPAPQVAVPTPAPVTPAPGTEQPLADAKPSPMPPTEPPAGSAPDAASRNAAAAETGTPPREAAYIPEPQPRRPSARSTPQPVTVITSPGGAAATLDGRAEASCTTPCTIEAAPGRHQLVITMPGYLPERRQVEVAGSSLELPPIVLRAPTGTLMLTSEPAGATVLVNGKRVPQATPAQLSLAPGTYAITVEKDGKQNSRNVEIREGAMSYLRFTLE